MLLQLFICKINAKLLKTAKNEYKKLNQDNVFFSYQAQDL